MAMYDVDMHIDDLVEFMFLKNVNNTKVELMLGGVENNKDLFCFCLDLFCKGLVLLFSKDGTRVLVEDMTYEQFETVRQKLACAGIKAYLDVSENESDVVFTNVTEIDCEEDNMPINQYEFKLQNLTHLYKLKFSFEHNM